MMKNRTLKIGFLFILLLVMWGCSSIDPNETLYPNNFNQEICDSCLNIMPPWWCCTFYPEYSKRLGINCSDSVCYDNYGRDTCDCLEAPDLCCDTNRQLAKSLGIDCYIDPCYPYTPIICDSCEKNPAWCCENYPDIACAKGYECCESICDLYPDLCQPPLCDSIWWHADSLVDSNYYATGRTQDELNATGHGFVCLAFGINLCNTPYFDAMDGIEHLAHRTSTTKSRDTYDAKYAGGKVTTFITNENSETHIADLHIYVEDAVEHQNGIYRIIYIDITGEINMNKGDIDNYLDIHNIVYKRAIVDIDNPDRIGKVDFDWKIYYEGTVKRIKYNPFKDASVSGPPIER